jgi:hypothetical protein
MLTPRAIFSNGVRLDETFVLFKEKKLTYRPALFFSRGSFVFYSMTPTKKKTTFHGRKDWN